MQLRWFLYLNLARLPIPPRETTSVTSTELAFHRWRNHSRTKAANKVRRAVIHPHLAPLYGLYNPKRAPLRLVESSIIHRKTASAVLTGCPPWTCSGND